MLCYTVGIVGASLEGDVAMLLLRVCQLGCVIYVGAVQLIPVVAASTVSSAVICSSHLVFGALPSPCTCVCSVCVSLASPLE